MWGWYRGTTIGYGLKLSYDKNGSVSTDQFLGEVGPIWFLYPTSPPQTLCTRGEDDWTRVFQYNSRHHLKEIDLTIGFGPSDFVSGSTSSLCYYFALPNQPLCTQPPISVLLQQYSYDGIDRVTETNCVPEPLGLSGGGVETTGYGICGQNPLHKHEYFYDYRRLILEELDLSPPTNPPGTNQYTLPSPTFDIVDHIYLGDQEVGRVLRQGNPGSACQAGDPDVDIEYVHQDSRGAIVAVESQGCRNRGG